MCGRTVEMRGETTYSLRAYRDDLERVQEHVARFDHEGDGKKYGSADALRWLWGEYGRLQQRITYLEVDNAGLLHESRQMEREIKKLRKTVTV